MMGFLILAGIVVNNGILLIDFTNILRKRGYRKSRSLLTAGLSRIRPILITAVTTCVAMVPLAMGTSEYVKVIGVPFSITVIGGLSVSTLLTLVFIPTLYSGVEEALKWFRNLNWMTKTVMILIIGAGIFLTIEMVENFVWKLADIFLIILGVPAVYWFVSTSLRKAKTTIISNEDEIHIRIRNLVKIYGRDNRFMREFDAGKKLSREAEIANPDIRTKLQGLIWQIPAVIFIFYLNWFYLTQGFWQVFMSVSAYIFILSILKGFLNNVTPARQRWINLTMKIVLYVYPLLSMVLIYLRMKNLALAIVLFVLWYLIIAIREASFITKSGDFERRKFHWSYNWFLSMISHMPVIGREKDTFKALRGVSVDIETGMFGLLGPNGAGKSTMMRIICGILEQSYGKIWINDLDTEKYREELQGLIGYLPQEFGMYENMTAHDYLDYQAILKNLTDKEMREERIRYVLSLVHMSEHIDKKIGTYSGGMKQRIGIAQVLLHLPRILVVDEPTAGLDPRERIRFRNLLVELSKGRIVIFSTHIIEDISSSCNIMAVIDKGDIIYKGTPRGLAVLAQGKVWKVNLPAAEFEDKTRNLLVIHHMRDGDKIRLRCLSESKPFENAVEESALLEDAYIWLLRSKNKSENVKV